MSKRNRERVASREPTRSSIVADQTTHLEKGAKSQHDSRPAPQTHQQQAHDRPLIGRLHQNESAVGAADDDCDDQEEEHNERHRLIAPESHQFGSARCKASIEPLLAGPTKLEGHHQQRALVHNSILGRLGGWLSMAASLAKSTNQPSKPGHNHTTAGLYSHRADFVYQPGAIDDEENDKYHQYHDETRPKPSRNGLEPPPPEYQQREPPHANQNSHWPSQQRSSLPISLFLVFFIGICVLVFELSSLIQDARNKLDETTEDLMEEQFGRQLDTAHRDELEQGRLTRWLVSTPKCHIPVLEPWDKSIEGYVNRNPPLNCSALLDDIVSGRSHLGARNWTGLLPTSMSYVKSNRLYFTEQALELGALSGPLATGQCCVKRVSRVLENDNDLEYGPCEPIYEQGHYVNSSIIEVVCAGWNYTNVHSFIVHNREEEDGLARVGSQRLSHDDDFYSVLLVGVDTISRLNGQRQLSQTLDTLKRLYGALEFVGYNKVGENTFPNLIPLLTGLTPEQLTKVQCWRADSFAVDESGDEYLDNCKFLWNYYQQIGYLTYLGEDWPQASTFNYLKPGFKYEPTTFYGRPFTLARDHLIFPKWQSTGCSSCQLDRPLVEVDMANLRAFIENNTNHLPYFAMHWFNCPQHDDLNGASQVDHVFEKFFQHMRTKLETDRTFVIFFSDHGYRWNDFVSTRIGHYESSLPMLTIAPPKAFIERHPDLYEHLKAHQNSLITPFDMFKTLIDLKDLSSGRMINLTASRDARQQTETTKSASSPDASAPQGASATTSRPMTEIKQVQLVDGTTFQQSFQSLSLFENHTSEQLDRSCTEAGIPDNYCVCHQFKDIAKDGLDVLGAAYYLVYVHLEARLKEHLDVCHPLDLERVHRAQMFDLAAAPSTSEKTASSSRRKRSPAVVISGRGEKPRPGLTSARPSGEHLHGINDDQNKHDYLPEREYNILFSTKPGGGLFQEVVRFYGANMSKCEFEVSRTRKVIEDSWARPEDKHESVLTMNDVCDFSVHSESLSRFNLYRDQSRCVKSNIELKKICYCREGTSLDS